MRYTYIKQHDATDCAAACMAMVCLHYKEVLSVCLILLGVIPLLKDKKSKDKKR